MYPFKNLKRSGDTALQCPCGAMNGHMNGTQRHNASCKDERHQPGTDPNPVSSLRGIKFAIREKDRRHFSLQDMFDPKEGDGYGDKAGYQRLHDSEASDTRGAGTDLDG